MTKEAAVADPAYVALVRERLALLHERIESAGGRVENVAICAVTKTFDVSACLAALDVGLVELGENYADELAEKAGALALLPLAHPPQWHFIGAIQRNKLARLAPHVAIYEGLDRLEEGVAIARRTPGARVFVEVASHLGPTRSGIAAEEVGDLVSALVDLGLEVRGLMTIGPPDDEAATRAAFRTVRGLADRIGLAEVSMGMTDDLEIAVEEGTTMVRVGRGLFGPRRAG